MGCDYPGGGGVEPLNETRGFSCDESGGVKPKRWGPGIVVRGKHHIALTPAGRAASVYRDTHERILRPPVIGIVAGTVVKREVSDVATETRSARIFLPENVMVLSIDAPGKVNQVLSCVFSISMLSGKILICPVP